MQRCKCTQFAKADPGGEVPKDRIEFEHFVKHGPIQPNQSEVRKTADLKGRTFQAAWYIKYPWLEYSTEKKAAFCFYCRHIASTTTYVQPLTGGGGHAAPDPTFIETGFSNWKAALEKSKGFQRHEQSSAHRHAVEAHNRFLNQKPVDVQVDAAHEQVLGARAKAIAKNRKVIARLFLIVLLLARLGLAFRGHFEGPSLSSDVYENTNRGNFLELIHFLANHGEEIFSDHLKTAPKNASYLSPATQNEMINLVGESILEEIRARVSESKFFVVLMDETRDNSHKEQVIVMVRYVYQKQVEERVIAIVVPGKTTGEALEGLLLSVLEKNGLDLKYCIGQCYDGGGNMAGTFKGVQARILARNPLAQFTHCYPHSLNRAVVNAMSHRSLPEAKLFFGNLQLLVTFINASVSRHEHFMTLQTKYLKELGSRQRPVVPSKGISDTRWHCRASTLHRFSSPAVLRAAVETVQHVAENDDEPTVVATARGLLKNVKAPDFVFLLAAFKPVLSSVNLVSEFLQSPKLDVGAAFERIDSLKAELASHRSSEAWDTAAEEARTLAGYISLDMANAMVEADSRTRRRKVPRTIDPNRDTQVQLSFEDRIRTQHYLPALDKLITEMSVRFPDSLKTWKFLQPVNFNDPAALPAIRDLAVKYGIDEEKCESQWRLFRHSRRFQDESMLDVFKAIPDCDKALKTLYQIFLTLPVTTASVERGFSKMALIKSKLRSVMGQIRLQSLLICNIEQDLCKKLDVKNLVDKFSDKERRANLG